MATSPLPSRGSPPLQSGQKNQKWPTCGQSGYVTPAVSKIPTASERGKRSEVAHKWAKWLCHPCRLGDPHRFRAGAKIRSGPLLGKVATSLLPSRGSPPLRSGVWGGIRSGRVKCLRHPCRLGDPHRFRAGRNGKRPTKGQSGYVTPAVSGIPTDSERGAKSEVARLWAKWLPHPCFLGEPPRLRAEGKIRSGPSLGKVPTSAPPSQGSRQLHSGGEIRSGPLIGKVPTSPPPSRGSQLLQSRGKMRSGPLIGKVPTSPLPSRESPPPESGGQNQKWPTSGQSGYVTPAVSGIPTASDRGGKIRSGPIIGKVATSPRPSQGSPPLESGEGEIRSGPLLGKVARPPLQSRGSPPLQSGGQNQKWPTFGQSGYVTPAVSGIPFASEQGGELKVAHRWAKWLGQPCRLVDPHRLRAGGKIGSGPQVGKVGTSPLLSRGSPPL